MTDARSKLEAVVRLSSLTHRQPESLGPGSKERKSVLVNLATDLGLDVDVRLPKPSLGERIAELLGTTWDASCWSTGSTVTLTGLNRLLLAAEERVVRAMGPAQPMLFEEAVGDDWGFSPARSKLEAVTRISALTGAPPEVLGPGSKDRKSALVNLARGLDLPVDGSGTKPVLGAAIAAQLGVAWDEDCYSIGATITLIGLNRLLEGAERRLAARPKATRGLFFSVKDEAAALLNTLRMSVPTTWIGRKCVEQMREAEYSQWAQDEWAAFYFEFVGLPALINTFGGGPRKFANTRFDYGLARPWDLKVHMAESPVAPLNDQLAMDEALSAAMGVGFLVLTGAVEYDDGQFRAWQREYRVRHGKRANVRVEAPRYVRKSKRRFRPSLIEAFFIEDDAALARAQEAGVIKEMRQGKQRSGAARPPKYLIDLKKARWEGSLLLGQVVL